MAGAACAPPPELVEACREVVCTAGVCILTERGAPTCVCSAADTAAGRTCGILTTYADDHANDRATATQVSLPVQAGGNINAVRSDEEADVDVFVLAAPAGTTLHVGCEEGGLRGCTIDITSAGGGHLGRFNSAPGFVAVKTAGERTYFEVSSSLQARGSYVLHVNEP